MRQLISAAFGLIVTLTFVTTEYSQRTAAVKHEAKPDKPAKTVAAITSDLAEAFSVIEKNYAGPEKVDPKALFEYSIGTMLETLDPHSTYFDADRYKQMLAEYSSRHFGIGSPIRHLVDRDGNVVATFVLSTAADSPARRAGLRFGDKIVEVDGKSMLGKPSSEVRDRLLGDEGSIVKVVVERLDTGKRETVEIKRGAVFDPTVTSSYLIRPGIGYMSMRVGFHDTTSAEFAAGLKKLRSEGMKQLVIDLRDNPGGRGQAAFEVASAFLAYGQMVFREKPRGIGTVNLSGNRTPERAPLVVLVDHGSASAAELFTGAMQDHDRALVVGESTFGKGIIQNEFHKDMPFGGVLNLTTARYHTPSWRVIQRDYANRDPYEYYLDRHDLRSQGFGLESANAVAGKEPRPEFKTDLGRTVYGGGGIDPDVVVRPKSVSPESERRQAKLTHPIFAFAIELAAGRVKGFENYKIEGPIIYGHHITKDDHPITDALIASFKAFAAERYGLSGAFVDSEKEYVVPRLRSLIITAAYGSVTAAEVFHDVDEQIIRGIELLPEAKRLADESAKLRPVSALSRKKPRRH